MGIPNLNSPQAVAAGLGGYVFYPRHRRPPNRHGSQWTAGAHKTRAATPGRSASRRIRLPDAGKVAFQARSGRQAFTQTIAIVLAAALFELTGCFAVWGWYRLDKGAVWPVPGVLSLVDGGQAGRAYAVYGVCILASRVWLWVIEGNQPGTAGT